MISRYTVCLIITLMSGAAALSHELLWTRRLVDILGATGQATSLVLGCFFFGLSAGAALASRRVDQIRNPWRRLALLELAIAALTLPAAFLPSLTEWIWPAMGPELLVSWPGQFVKLAITGLVVVPPAFAMGMTLPLLIVGVERSVTRSRAAKIVIYAVNTLGGACGLLVTSVWLLPTFGVLGSMLIAMLANCLVAAIAYSMHFGRRTVRENKRRKPLDTNTQANLSNPTCLGIAAFSGMTVLGLEIIAIRLLSLVVHSSFQATSGLLMCVILLLGMAALLVPVMQMVIRTPRWQLVIALSLSAIGSAAAPQLLLYRTQQLINVPALAAMNGESINGVLDFQIKVMSVAFATIGVSIFFAGLVFPLLFASVPREKNRSSGGYFALLLAVNGIGGLVGALLAENLLLASFGIYRCLIVIGAIQACAAMALAMSVANWQLAVPAVIGFATCLLFYPSTSKLPYVTPRSTRKFEVEEVVFGKEGVCLITKAENSGRGILMNNQYLLGSTMAFHEQRRQVFMPLLFHAGAAAENQSPEALEVCCLGLATGISAGAALDYDERCHVTAVEISPMVVAAARDHFGTENKEIVTSPRATVIVEDARTYISAARNKYDVIAGDLYRPYGAGEGRLFSVEHFRNVRQALRPGGVYCHWIAAYQVTEEHFNMIAATFLKAFPDAALLRVETETGYPQFGLLGSKDSGKTPWAKVAKRCEELKARGVGDPTLHDLESVKAMYVGKLSATYFADAPINTLNNARLEIVAGLHRVTLDPRKRDHVGKDVYLQGKNWERFSQKLKDLSTDDGP